jgi:chromosome partitioning protein
MEGKKKMKVTFCNQKGGVGKTSTTVQVGMAMKQAGHHVGLIDLDPQQTATQWAGMSAGLEMAQPGKSYALILVDTPSRLDAPELLANLRDSDVVVLVTSPSPADLWSSKAAVDVIKRHARKNCKVRILFNKVQRNTRLGNELELMAKQIGLEAFKNTISQRQMYQHAMLDGWAALTPEAEKEIFKVAMDILHIATLQ